MSNKRNYLKIQHDQNIEAHFMSCFNQYEEIMNLTYFQNSKLNFKQN